MSQIHLKSFNGRQWDILSNLVHLVHLVHLVVLVVLVVLVHLVVLDLVCVIMLKMSYLISLHPVLFENIAHVKYFLNFNSVFVLVFVFVFVFVVVFVFSG